jgi:hypothetical protein
LGGAAVTGVAAATESLANRRIPGLATIERAA